MGLKELYDVIHEMNQVDVIFGSEEENSVSFACEGSDFSMDHGRMKICHLGMLLIFDDDSEVKEINEFQYSINNEIILVI